MLLICSYYKQLLYLPSCFSSIVLFSFANKFTSSSQHFLLISLYSFFLISQSGGRFSTSLISFSISILNSS
ncbi:unnamed protein product [Acanthoscelides obtectus]|uniref:Uncharacterized protein n=1 Tax=Acanthoscelides obtectus TaxID=200917 RepID=A0A9P0ME70_ACAOB|nr:unnamed protein product [Acanthoscelides obtectus]CAK1671572.1 hypothetical protein AOBTE_LOCUS28329 [Acanthoscelides obtectus]